MTTNTTRTVHCPCGAVEIELTGEPLAQFYCHCDDCQLVFGAAYVPEVVFKADQVVVKKGETRSWTLKRNPRITCAVCSAKLFIDVIQFKLRGLNGYLFPKSASAADTVFKPQFHVNCRFAVMPIKDDLPHYEGMPPMFRGSDARVAW